MDRDRLICVRQYPKGKRVWLCGQRVHHLASGSVLGVACLAARRRRVALALLAWAATDYHDWRVAFRREGIPAGELVSALTSELDELSRLRYLPLITYQT